MEQNRPQSEPVFSPYKLIQNVSENCYDIIKRDNEKILAKFFYSFEDEDYYKEYSAFNAANRAIVRLNDERYDLYSQAVDNIKWKMIHYLHDKFKNKSIEDLRGETFGEMVRSLDETLSLQNFYKINF